MSLSPSEQIKQLLLEKRRDFDNDIRNNGEYNVVDFFISELTNKMREDVIYARMSQVYGITKLLKQKVPNIKINRVIDCEPFILDGKLIEEGTYTLHVSWDQPFPGTGEIPLCCQPIKK